MNFPPNQLDQLTPHDREELEKFSAFLQAVGAPTAENKSRLKAWIEADPEPHLAYLGVTLEEAREWGYEV